MKKLTLISILFTSLQCWALTTFTYNLLNIDGSAYTNQAQMSAYPPVTQSVIVVGTNIVFANAIIPLNPNVNGKGTNSCMAGQYKVYMPSNNIFFIVSVPDTASLLPLATYVVGAPVVYQSSSLYGFITNALGFQPLASNTAAILGGLAFQPATNSLSCITNLLTFQPVPQTYSTVTNALAYIPARQYAWNTNLTILTVNPAGTATNRSTLCITNSVIWTNSTP